MISARERTLNYVVLVVFAVYALYPLVMIVDLAVSPDLSGDAAGAWPTLKERGSRAGSGRTCAPAWW